MERDWARLGSALADARDKIGLTQIEIADRIGVTRTAIQSIERGATRKKFTGTMRSYARLIGWADGSIEAVLAGQGPTQATDTGDQPKAERAELPALKGLPLRVVQELDDDRPVLDARVLDLTPYGSDARVTVVVKPAPNATPEEVRQALLAWERAELRLQSGDGADGPLAADEA